ncbi:hypothetical protein CROQUDRAFT_88278 [Cronartium quercuum f. sp. fusiforme G11]|uniref:CCHC-type domain-containing protein n=1 Tax=Cronartium quercuum f. sp. fusiforme G11 TaxID=708437 RepID=A0A9P6NU29_9BASI|nr:hypothetical protein CROQUDRAFT_88278 [Cronartium quercuum f. sp. fusiforme G11]
MSTKMESDSISSKNRLSILGFEKLNAPGSESNYLNWSLVARSVLQTEGLLHMIKRSDPKDRPTTYKADCMKVKTFFLCYVETSNYTVIRQCRDDTTAMWSALQELHLDLSSALKMYWLKSLVTERMEGDNVDAYLDKVQTLHDHLNSLVTPENPLRTDDILVAAISLAVPTNWQHTLTALLQHPNVTSITVSKARTTLSADHPLPMGSWTGSEKQLQSWRDRQKITCNYCEKRGHAENECQSKLSEELDMTHKELRKLKSRKRAGKEKASAAFTKRKDDSSDIFLSSSLESASLVRMNAASLLNLAQSPLNIDSGCSKSMAPTSTPLINLRPSNTSVMLADNSVIKATAVGSTTLPFSPPKTIDML